MARLSCEDSSMPLVWVTGRSGVGKSTVCVLLTSRGELAAAAKIVPNKLRDDHGALSPIT